MNAWMNLMAAAAAEIVFASLLRESEGFSRLLPSIGFAVAGLISFLLLSRAIQVIPLGTAYAVWTGIGVVGTTLVGIFFYGEPTSAVRLVFLGLAVTAIIGLKATAP